MTHVCFLHETGERFCSQSGGNRHFRQPQLRQALLPKIEPGPFLVFGPQPVSRSVMTIRRSGLRFGETADRILAVVPWSRIAPMKRPAVPRIHLRFPTCPLLVVLGGVLAAGVTAQAGDWPQILGPHRNGIADDEHLASQWPAGGPKTLWQRPVSPPMNSSGRFASRTQSRRGRLMPNLRTTPAISMVFRESWDSTESRHTLGKGVHRRCASCKPLRGT